MEEKKGGREGRIAYSTNTKFLMWCPLVKLLTQVLSIVNLMGTPRYLPPSYKVCLSKLLRKFSFKLSLSPELRVSKSIKRLYPQNSHPVTHNIKVSWLSLYLPWLNTVQKKEVNFLSRWNFVNRLRSSPSLLSLSFHFSWVETLLWILWPTLWTLWPLIVIIACNMAVQRLFILITYCMFAVH